MTPQEKAQELIATYEDILGHSGLNVCHTADLEEETKITAIECAKQTVEEILKVDDSIYWHQVIHQLLQA